MKYLTLALALTSSTPIRVTVTLPADFPARIERVARAIGEPMSVEEFTRYAVEAELTGLEGTLHIGAKRE